MAASIICRTWFGLVWVVRATKVAPAEMACFIGLMGWSSAPVTSVLLLKPMRRGGRSLFLGQAVDPVVHDDVGHLDVLAGGVVEMVAADGKGVAVAAEDEDMQVRAAEGNAAGEGQGAAMDVMHAVGLDEIRKPAGAADAGDGGDFLVPQLALFDQLEVKREHGEIAAAGAPRRVVGGDFLFGQALAFGSRQRRDGW